ncbi:MAG: hypothetical protein R3A48_10695 [Polyangiales bacterium]
MTRNAGTVLAAASLALALAPRVASAQTAPSEPTLGLQAHAELGFVGVLDHFIRLGLDGSRVDYRRDGAQDTLFPFARVSVDLDIHRRHTITLLYQPLELVTRETLSRDLRIDGATFAAGTPVNFRYGFPFYRGGWAYDVLAAPDRELSFGVALQIRNATIDFETRDGSTLRSRSDIGFVPLLRARGRFPISRTGFFAFDVDGFYAPISVLNGSDNEVVGAILDASARVGWRVRPHVDVFLSVRYIGGGATGQGSPTPTSDGYQSNWLNFLSLSLGATLDSRATR